MSQHVNLSQEYIHLFFIDGDLIGWGNGESRLTFEELLKQVRDHVKKLHGDIYEVVHCNTEDLTIIELCTKSKSTLPIRDPLKVRSKLEMRKVKRVASIKKK